ncbi:MAG: CHAT domain-containing protein [Calditrichia bacterium]
MDEEIREIDTGLRRSKHRDDFELVKKHALRNEDLRQALLDEEPNIIHFCGHGYNSETGGNGIVLVDDDGLSYPIDSSAIADLIGILSDGIHCVVLNACYTVKQAAAIGEHIPYVVGMREEINDEIGIEFSKGFYDGIGAGKTVETSFKLGCNAIDMKNLSDELLPILKKQPGASDHVFVPRHPEEPSTETSEQQPSIHQEADVTDGSSYQAGGDINIHHGENDKPEGTRNKIAVWLGIVAAIATIITFVFDIPGRTGLISISNQANTVTVLVHGEKGKDQLILPNRGKVKLIYGDAIVSEQINDKGEATFKQVPENFFTQGSRVEVLFHDPKGEPYRAIYHDSLYQLTKGEYVSLVVKLFGLGEIRGIVRDFETGDPIEGVRLSIQDVVTFSNEFGEYAFTLPPDKQRKLQTIRATKAGYTFFELDSIPPQTGREIPILMKPKEN